MHEWGADLFRIGKELKGEFGPPVQLLASVLIVMAAGWSLLKRIGSGIGKGWRKMRGSAAVKPDDDTIEGA